MLLTKLKEGFTIQAQIASFRGGIKLACQSVGIFFPIHLFKVFYPFVIIYFFKVRLECNSGGVGIWVKVDAPFFFAEGIELAFRICVKGSHHVLEHLASDLAGKF